MSESRPDGQPTLTAEQRDALFERALETVRHRAGFIPRAQRQWELTADAVSASIALLDESDATVALGVRTHVEALVDPMSALVNGPTALVGSQFVRARSTIEDALAVVFGDVAMVEGGAKLVAHALVIQPRIVVVHDDVVHPSPVEAAVLVRALAPATVVLVASDHPLVLDDAARVAITTCSPSIDVDELTHMLDRLLR